MADLYAGLEQSQNSVEILRTVGLLQGLRAGMNDRVIERYELLLDAAITAGDSNRQLHGTPPEDAMVSLTAARNYRLQYPRKDTAYFKRVNAILGIDPSTLTPTPVPTSP